MAGYLSLFFDDSSTQLPSETLDQAKSQIFSNYKKVFRKPHPQEKRDLQQQIENRILTEIEGQLQQGNVQGEANLGSIQYWDVSVGAAMAALDKSLSMVEKVNIVLDRIELIQNTLSNAISTSGGKISQNLVEQMKKDKEILAGIAQQFSGQMSEDSFRGAFFGALKGAVAKAQGSIHEAAVALAAAGAKAKVEKELAETNQKCRLIVEATGGRLIEGSAFSDKENLGRVNNAKNDITVAMEDGNGHIIWSTGISLKSTSSSTPQMVKVMEQSLGTLLNKIYAEGNYINWAGALGTGDWSGTRVGIGALAQKQNVTTSGAELAEAWKTAVYNAIYSQVIDMFSGVSSGGILNNAQYLIINATPIAMYDIFSRLEMIQNPAKLDSIQGLTITGKMAAISRQDLVSKNVNAFVRTTEKTDSSAARIERSTKAWSEIHQSLMSKKIKISLNYASLYGGTTR